MRYPCSGAVFLISVFFSWGLFGCNANPPLNSSDLAIKVNGVEISIEEFNDQIKLQAYSDPEMELTRENREAFADYLIRKELMIQEAMRQKMDRQEEFIKTIETYWESTLIRRLLDHKTAELKKKILITEDEMAAYYDQHKAEFGQPYESVKEDIRKTLESERLEADLAAWTQDLRARANIRVNPSLIAAKN